MNKLKKENGITLIALIITIVVLLILAVVAIGAAQDSNIVGYAQNAAGQYEEGKAIENNTIAGYEDILAQYANGISSTGTSGGNNGGGNTGGNIGGTTEPESIDLTGGWEQLDENTVKNIKTGKTIEIGKAVRNADVLTATGGTQRSYTGAWTILGIENEQLKLVSTENVTTSDVYLGYSDAKAPTNLEEIYNNEENNLEKAIWSYKNAENTLKEYAQDLTGITSARSINIEDIEAICNITNDKKLELTNGEYGKEYTYSYNNGNEGVYVSKEGETVVLDTANEEVKLDYTYYGYDNALTNTKFANSLGTGTYWLASSCVDCGTNYAYFRVRNVQGGSISYTSLIDSYGYGNDSWNGVRAVVYI